MQSLEQYGVKGDLLSRPAANPKTTKNGKLGIFTVPLHLAPARLSGYNTCAQSTPQCERLCLHTAGNPCALEHKTKSRIARTIAYFEAREAFMARLAWEISRHIKRAAKLGMRPAIRLNGTSDIPFERVKVTIDGVTYPNLMTAFPQVIYYDYTKITKRARAALGAAWPTNYRLTYSLTENNDNDAADILSAGGNVAAVFNTRRNRPLPASYTIAGRTFRVIDADEHDFRPIDPPGTIAGLRAKGAAIGAGLGFVRNAA